MKKHIFPLIFTIFCVLCTFSCHNGDRMTDEEKIIAVADSFSCHYFTWHFDRAMNFSDEGMKRYLTFIASNVHKADIETLLSTTEIPVISVGETTMEGDSMATVVIDLKDVILMDTIGERAHLYPNAQKALRLRKTNDNEWKVTEIRQ